MEKRRVVITGLGCISPVGNSPVDAWDAIKNGVSGISRISLFDTSDLRVHIAGEVKNFNPEDFSIEKKQLRKMARFTKFAVAAADQAVKDSGYEKGNIELDKCGVVIGCCIGGTEATETAFKTMNDYGPSRIPPLTTPLMLTNEAAANITIHLGLKRMAWTLGTACASSTDAIGLSAELIKSGRMDMCLAGGTEATLTRFSIATYDSLQTLSTSFNDCPEKASRPFDKDRDGFVTSEGSAVLFLEELEHAKKRGARIYAELAGYGCSCDAYNIASPMKDGSTAALALTEALEDAGISGDKLDYYNAHGTATFLNDVSESMMLKAVLGDHAKKISISSTKSMTGHMLGAAGAMEAIVCIKSMENNFVPPTINLENQDYENGCDLDYTAEQGKCKEINYAASGSFGFGGHNSCLIFKKYF